ncbi:helix-turn-helix domain-containing protein [Streptomyces sp. TRM66268-LWL]|uniref:Helix-turn-helix domain-containing protein n=1 Tax=Streptomyces polyasparticus TaxID=2767826 RepID=A0ABR7SNT4_9ACTN|nr:helix-turn-helix domain-containing protein [Streptomyces polyasparticus]MBC9716579.1 helix-turn-helix domain-containing protein [Streptomyces polyasparticus]
MTGRPRAGLGRVLEDLGTTLLDLVCGDPDSAGAIGGVVIHDPLDEPVLPRRALVLGIGVHTADETVRLLGELGAADAAALVVRAPAPADPAVTAAAEAAGVALLALTRGASWAQLAAMLRSLLAEDDVGEGEPGTLGGIPSGDLFAVANAVAALLDAPITIEDRSSRVLAFSGRQDEADPSRVETVLGRQVPERFTRFLEDQGVFRALYRGDQPVQVAPPATEEFHIPRVAIAVRAGDELLGSIWAAVRTPLNAQRTQALHDAAKLVALHLLRQRAGADVERRLRADLVATVLEGGPRATEALARLGLADHGGVVLALTAPDPPEAAVSTAVHARHAAERQRLADAFAMHLSAVHPRSASGLIGDVAYGILPVAAHTCDGEERAVRVGTDFLSRIGDRLHLLIGIGPRAADGGGLARSREGADRALRVLRTGGGPRRLARIADVHIEALLLELADLTAERGDPADGPLARLLAYDRAHDAHLVGTLRAWLNAFGDVPAAAASMYVHQNTFRYRLRRVAEVAQADLADPEARFALMLQLRLLQGPDAAAG